MELIKFDEMKKTWHQIARHHDAEADPSFQLEVHKKLLNIFHVGDYYYYIINLARVEFEFISDSVLQVMRCSSKEQFTVEYIYNNIHPDDKPRFVAHEQQVTAFFNALPMEKVMKYKVSYDYRLLTMDGDYKWILMQTTTIQTDMNGAVIRVLGVQTDITHLKQDNKPSGLSFIGLEGEPSFYNVPINQAPVASASRFTRREQEVLKLMAAGNSTKKIAALLFLSVHTVNTHRKKILAKSGCQTLAELISKTLSEGWV
ncbi:MAG: LuxR C-terminal-related transcriptional regulator [Candidatus Pseudobacter hemicellulosilyticus]|uniref:LuxR C-terminal-related transcriptional regulator n=1 Tax=Candidatus Pseudobacter hemicellulosilyticus TaxID=3121375 RepID=A0AAJ5WVF6_9BACT|nr:MAG: LuxR C-terminal-related transcriptional regulator [Pseudobacter sp.]